MSVEEIGMTAPEDGYEKGVLKEDKPAQSKDQNGKTPAEIMAEIAAHSNPVKPGDENASVEHDKYLYGWDKKQSD